MGFYANGDWMLKFRDDDAVHFAAVELDEAERKVTNSNADPVHPATTEEGLASIAANIGRRTSDYPEMEYDAETLEVFGQTYGKIGYWTDEIVGTLAKYATGTVDWKGEDASLWRDRLFGDGTTKGFSGEVVYPGDGDSESVVESK